MKKEKQNSETFTIRKDFKDVCLDYSRGGVLKEKYYFKDIVLYFIKNDSDVRDEIVKIFNDIKK